MAITTTGGFTSTQLKSQAEQLEFSSFSAGDSLDLGELALSMARSRGLPIAIEVWHTGRLIFKAALPGTSAENDDWLRRKKNVADKFDDSTMAVRVRHEEQGLDFNTATLLPLVDYAAHGGGWPIKVIDLGTVGFFGISGLPQVEDHKLIIECLEVLHQK
jgi:uncharacterized protein (UPF0303 family)